MEVLEGKNLADLQAERIEATGNGYFEPEEIEPWLQQAAAALDYAHAEGRAHRDLKPQNFMIETATGRLKIMDFGISRRIGDSHATLTGKDSSGTLPYMSPQQVLGDAPTSSDDIYGIGATLYDLLTGSPPFIGGDIPSQVREKPPTPLNQRRAEVNAEAAKPIPAAWEQAVLTCLSKKREDRPSSAGAAHQFISQCQANQAKAAAVAERARRAVEVHATQAEKRCHEEQVAAWKRPRAAPERVVPDFSPPQPGASKAPLLAQRISQSQSPPKVAQVFNLWAPSLRAKRVSKSPSLRAPHVSAQSASRGAAALRVPQSPTLRAKRASLPSPFLIKRARNSGKNVVVTHFHPGLQGSAVSVLQDKVVWT